MLRFAIVWRNSSFTMSDCENVDGRRAWVRGKFQAMPQGVSSPGIQGGQDDCARLMLHYCNTTDDCECRPQTSHFGTFYQC